MQKNIMYIYNSILNNPVEIAVPFYFSMNIQCGNNTVALEPINKLHKKVISFSDSHRKNQ